MHGLLAIVAGGRITIPCPIVLLLVGVVGKPWKGGPALSHRKGPACNA
jgi:hypothetical protein